MNVENVVSEQARSKLIDKVSIANRYQVSIRTITDWMSNGTLPYLKMGTRTVRFDPEDCDRAIRERFEVKDSSAVRNRLFQDRH